MLIDTNVWAELTKPKPEKRVIEFLIENESQLYLSTIVLAEMEFGIAKAADPVRAERLLVSRNDAVLRAEDRVLFPDFLTAIIWGKLKAELASKGQPIADFDLLLCAQALAAEMPIVTRNVGHMERTGVLIINPWIE